MKNVLVVLLGFIVGLAASTAHASDKWKETVSTNGVSGVSGTLRNNTQYKVECDAAAYMVVCTSVSCTSTAAAGSYIAANLPYDVIMGARDTNIAFLNVAGAASCKIFETKPRTIPVYDN